MNSVFYNDILEYLELRKGLVVPSTYSVDKCALLSFDQHLVQRGKSARNISEEDISSWLDPMRAVITCHTIGSKVRTLRGFLRYLQFNGTDVYIPPVFKTTEHYTPYIFSQEELARLFAAADSIRIRKGTIHHLIMPMLLRLLYSCGFRLGEILAVQIGDIDFARGVIFLRNTKNRKERIVPMTESLTIMLYRYCIAINVVDDPENYIFPSKLENRPITKRSVEEWFETLLKKTGIYVRTKKRVRGPCLHCFRHLFAVNSFVQAAKHGYSVNDSVPFLSVYMGHKNIWETEKYLKFSSEMFPELSEPFETFADSLFPEVSYED